MPHYDYVCAACGRRTDVRHGIHEPGPTVCPDCGGALRKALSTPAIVFKGSGWAKKDARSAAYASSGAGRDAAGETKSEGAGESKGEAKGDSRNADKPDAKGQATPDSKSERTSEGSGASAGVAAKSDARTASAASGGSATAAD